MVFDHPLSNFHIVYMYKLVMCSISTVEEASEIAQLLVDGGKVCIWMFTSFVKLV